MLLIPRQLLVQHIYRWVRLFQPLLRIGLMWPTQEYILIWKKIMGKAPRFLGEHRLKSRTPMAKPLRGYLTTQIKLRLILAKYLLKIIRLISKFLREICLCGEVENYIKFK